MALSGKHFHSHLAAAAAMVTTMMIAAENSPIWPFIKFSTTAPFTRPIKSHLLGRLLYICCNNNRRSVGVINEDCMPHARPQAQVLSTRGRSGNDFQISSDRDSV